MVAAGITIVGEQERGSLGVAMGLSALGSELVLAGLYEVDGEDVSRAIVYAFDAEPDEWVVRGAPLIGSAAAHAFAISVALSDGGDVVAMGSRGPNVGFSELSISVYDWIPRDSQYVRVGNPLAGVLGVLTGGSASIALSWRWCGRGCWCRRDGS